MCVASNKGNLPIIQLLVSRNANVNARDSDGITPLHHAAYSGKGVEVILGKGADIEVKDKSGWAPLHHAAMNGQLDTVRLLVTGGANILAKDRNGKTPLDVANQYRKSQVAGFLRSLVPTPPPVYRRRSCDWWQKLWYPSWCNERIRVSRSIGRSYSELPVSKVFVRGFDGENQVISENMNISAPDINGGILLVDMLMAKRGARQIYTPSVDKQISSLEAQAYALNIVSGFESILKQAALRCGISVRQLKVNFRKLHSNILKKIMAEDYRGVSDILYSVMKKACPALEQKKKFSMSFKGKIEQMLQKEMMPLLDKEILILHQ